MKISNNITKATTRSVLDFTLQQVITALRDYAASHDTEFDCTADEMFLWAPDRHPGENTFKLGVDKDGENPGIREIETKEAANE